MKFTINQNVLNTLQLSLQEFSILLYYIAGGKEIIHPLICDKLWNNNFLIKENNGYSFNYHKYEEIENAMISSVSVVNSKEELKDLAQKLRDLFPEGRKEGTSLMWKGNTMEIVKKLMTLKSKFECEFTADQAINATKRYIESFNGNYQYMQILKYFILKRDLNKGEETSQLLSYIENESQADFKAEVGELL